MANVLDTALMARCLPAVMGVIYLLVSIFRLITGGPREIVDGRPRPLYDRVYFLLRIFIGITIVGLGIVFWLITGDSTNDRAVDLFSRVAGLMVAAMALPMLMRGDMMYRAARYLKEHGLWGTRWLHLIDVLRFQYYGANPSKAFAVFYGLFGLIILILGSRLFELYDQLKGAIASMLRVS
ncbi:hypothetical protein [Asticcacaulis taihuensis]|uniref:hypothetical protein n=1 Tax=Asticcacaulis taihuensis TaxID=260084 RepID=UPI003F7BDA71